MLSFNVDKKILISVITLALFANCDSAFAQFYDLNEESGSQIYSNQQEEVDTATLPLFTEDKVEQSPEIETSGDEGGFIPEKNPDDDIYAKAREEMNGSQVGAIDTIPVADELDGISGEIVEEEIKEQLRDISQLDYIGFLDSNFDEGLWRGVSFKDAENKLGKLSSKEIGSIHVKRILRNMLIAKARPPKTPEDKSWLVLRLKTLLNMGNLSDVQLLLKDVTAKELSMLKNDDLNSLYVQANLLNPQVDSFLKTMLAENPTDVKIKTLFMINLYNTGKVDQAKLTFNALSDSNTDFANSNFAKLFKALLNKEIINVENITKPSILEQYTIALKPELFKGIDYSTFKDKTLFDAIENTKNLAIKTKIAETLMQAYPYSYNINVLNKVYEEYTFSSAVLSVPLKFIKGSEDVFKNRALLYQSSKIAGLNSTKALALKKLWESYEQNGLNNIKLLITERTQNIALNTSIAWFSQDILNGQLLHANIEYSTLKVLYENIDQVYSNTKFLNMQIALEFLRRTSVIGLDFDSIQDYKEILDYWFGANEIKSKETYNYVLKVLTLLDAVQADIPEEMWAKLYSKSNLELKTAESNPIWLRLVGSSIQRGEKGKSLLYIIDSFADKTPQELDPQTLANVISCLNFLNMPQEMALIGMQAILKN